MSLQPGTTFAGRYELVRRLAEGGMGAVYEVIHIETGRRRALKVLHPHVLKDKKAREQFRRESRVGGVLETESIVDVFDAGIDEATKTPFLVMELLRGEDLGKRLDRLGPLPAAEVVMLLGQVAFAVDKAHTAGIIHRDLKLDNLFLHEREQGPAQVKILDFGVAKIVADAGMGHGETLSVGTPMFMAPEQFTGSQPVGAEADRYALAHVAYMLLVGEPYFEPEAESESAMLAFAARVVAGPKERASVRALRRRSVHLPAAVDTWFAIATHGDPAQRHRSAGALVEHLESALGLSMSNAPTVVSHGVPGAPNPSRVVVPVHAATPPVEDAGGRGKFGSSISGTTTPHRPQPGEKTPRKVLLLVAGVIIGGGSFGAVLWLASQATAPAGTPGPAAAVSEEEATREPGAAPSPSSEVVVEPTEPAPSSTASAMPSSTPPASASAAAPPASTGAASETVAPPPRPPPRPPATTPAPPPSAAPPKPPKYSRD